MSIMPNLEMNGVKTIGGNAFVKRIS